MKPLTTSVPLKNLMAILPGSPPMKSTGIVGMFLLGNVRLDTAVVARINERDERDIRAHDDGELVGITFNRFDFTAVDEFQNVLIIADCSEVDNFFDDNCHLTSRRRSVSSQLAFVLRDAIG